VESDGALHFDPGLICFLIQRRGLHPHGVELMSAFLLAKINGINELAEWFRVAFTSKKVVNMLAALVVLSGAPVITDRLATACSLVLNPASGCCS
jgi:hypothetical protein